MICQDGQNVADWLSDLCDQYNAATNGVSMIPGKVLVTQPGLSSTMAPQTTANPPNPQAQNPPYGYPYSPYSPNVVVVPNYVPQYPYPGYPYPQQQYSSSPTIPQVTQGNGVRPLTPVLSLSAIATVVLTVNGVLVTVTQEIAVPIPTDVPTGNTDWALSLQQPTIVNSDANVLPIPTPETTVVNNLPTNGGVVRPIALTKSSTRTAGIGRPIIVETAIADVNVVNAPGSQGGPLVDGNLGFGNADGGNIKKTGNLATSSAATLMVSFVLLLVVL
jgi:hypothetical protein